jgi:hypothetical protein
MHLFPLDDQDRMLFWPTKIEDGEATRDAVTEAGFTSTDALSVIGVPPESQAIE